MKTLKDLINLIAKEAEDSEGKMVQYQFMLDTRFNWLSMDQLIYNPFSETEEGREQRETICSHLPIETPAQVQQAFWLVWNNGRTRHEEDRPENATHPKPEPGAILIPVPTDTENL
jgi:hypothetical protein